MDTAKRSGTPVEKVSWAHFDHDADIGIRGEGPTLASAFEQAGLAVTAVVSEQGVRAAQTVSVICEAPDPEVLFTDWINALVFEMATRSMLFSRFEVTIEHNGIWRLQAHISGEPVDRVRHEPTVEVKGATFTELRVHEDENGIWHAQCILDV